VDIVRKEGYKSSTAKHDSGGEEYKYVYVITNKDTSDFMEYRILNSPEIPNYGDPFPPKPSLIVTNIDITQIEDLNYYMWECEVTYSIPDDDEVVSDNWQRDLQVSVRAQQYDVPFEMGYSQDNRLFDGNNKILFPVESTTGEPLITTKYKNNTIIDISENVANFNFDWIREYVNTTNKSSGSICGMSVKSDQARILEMAATSQVDNNGNSYYSRTISIEITQDIFNIQLMNRGFKYLNDADELVYILKKDVAEGEIDTETGEERIDEPAKLDLFSRIAENDEAFYIEFKPYKSESWSTLGISTSQP
jgi:hypothetical protein